MVKGQTLVAQINIDHHSVFVEVDDRGQLWRSRLDVPLEHIVRVEVVRDGMPERQWLSGAPGRSAGMASANTLRQDGRNLFCDISDLRQVIVISLRDHRYDRLFVQVDQPAETAAHIQRAIQDERLPANTLAFLLGVLETDDALAAMIQGSWQQRAYALGDARLPSPTDVARAVLGDEDFDGAWAAGRAASVQLHAVGTTQRPDVSARGLLSGGRCGITLSAREQEVLGLVAEGGSNQEIADALMITERTARYHVTSIFNKLGADNRAHAVALAAQRGWLPAPLAA